MARPIAKGDTAFLSHVAENKFLTVKQLSAITQRTGQVVRRRLRRLEDQRLVMMKERGFGTRRGRRENIIIVTQEGLDVLGHNEILSEHAAYVTDKTSESIFIDHDLMVNWFLIHLLQIERDNPEFAVQHLTTSSHSLKMGNADNPLLQERFAADDASEDTLSMIPDGVLTISHGKETLLFFLEVDMGTEVMTSAKPGRGTIHQKIINYQTIFRGQQYKRYEKIFEADLNGFRLLFLANDLSGMKRICNLVQQVPPSDFIWVTDQDQMFSHGVSGQIWMRGGRHHKAPESILGRQLAFKAAVVDKPQ